MTNSISDDMFNTDFIIDQPTDYDVIDIGPIDNIISDITVEMPEEKQVDSYSASSGSTIMPFDKKQTPTIPTTKQIDELNFKFDELCDQKKLKSPEVELPPPPPPTINYKQPEFTIKQEPVKPVFVNENEEKLKLLLELQGLEKRKGITLSRHYNMSSSLEEIRIEHKHQTNMINMDNGIKELRSYLIGGTFAIEKGTQIFTSKTGIGANYVDLDGWSKEIGHNIMDYDGVLERLYLKYADTMNAGPEIELIRLLVQSASQYCLTNYMIKMGGPKVGEVLRERPEVLNALQSVFQEASRRTDIPPPKVNMSSTLESLGMKQPDIRDLIEKQEILSVGTVDSQKSNGSRKAIISPMQNKKGISTGNVIKF